MRWIRPGRAALNGLAAGSPASRFVTALHVRTLQPKTAAELVALSHRAPAAAAAVQWGAETGWDFSTVDRAQGKTAPDHLRAKHVGARRGGGKRQ